MPSERGQQNDPPDTPAYIVETLKKAELTEEGRRAGFRHPADVLAELLPPEYARAFLLGVKGTAE
jgi:hypothetical protein